MLTREGMAQMLEAKYPKAAKSGAAYIKTAQHMNDYVTGHADVAALKRDFWLNGIEFLSGQLETSLATTLNAALNLSKILETYPDTGQSKRKLKAMELSLYASYERPLAGTKDNLYHLMTFVKQWREHVEQEADIDPDLVRETSKLLYTTLMVTAEKLKENWAGWLTKPMIVATGIQVDDVCEKIQGTRASNPGLLKQIETLVAHVEARKASVQEEQAKAEDLDEALEESLEDELELENLESGELKEDKTVAEVLDLQVIYRGKVEALRRANDALLGVTSSQITREDGEERWVRDAVACTALDDIQALEQNHRLLRCLARLRAIDYQLAQRDGCEAIREDMKEKFTQFEHAVASDEPLDEKAFNTFLIETLHEAELTRGCVTKRDAEALLGRYQILSHVLDPAVPSVTRTYDETSQILQEEVHFPVTKKTAFQKEAIQAMQHKPAARRNAVDGVNAVFAELMLKDDRMLPAEAGGVYLEGGSKQSVVIEARTVFDVSDVDEKALEALRQAEPFWLVQTGRPVYTGQACSDELREQHIQENLKQIKRAAETCTGRKNKKLHVTVMNDGESGYEPLIHVIDEGTQGHQCSHIPTRFIRSPLHKTQLSPLVKQQVGRHDPWFIFGEKKGRFDTAVEAVWTASTRDDFISCVNSDTVIEAVLEEETLRRWRKQSKEKGAECTLSSTNRTHQRNTPFSSCYSGERVAIELSDVSFLKMPSESAITAYTDLFEQFETACDPHVDDGVLLAHLKASAKTLKASFPESAEIQTSEGLYYLSEVLCLSTGIIQCVKAGEIVEAEEKIAEMVALREVLSEDERWCMGVTNWALTALMIATLALVLVFLPVSFVVFLALSVTACFASGLISKALWSQGQDQLVAQAVIGFKADVDTQLHARDDTESSDASKKSELGDSPGAEPLK